ncbi:hypothetical protein [Salisediminibacterium beveridgei]|uniref:GAF domain-containing protein n=1 Tax=Salisediminibacterium beveridgei TaxID=632773 RepID=A0A1D7QWG1_9BACI|nr:hypothetical protein [Salisediminibacterium beveridgei]AOM83318.1 hypothetical protein BBEV_1957 [Salisediminibacterium beveridgei]
MNNKSDLLDEMRMEIGLSYDYAKNRDDFIIRILSAIHDISNGCAKVHLYGFERNGLKRLIHHFDSQNNENIQPDTTGYQRLAEYGHLVVTERNGQQIFMIPVIEGGRIHFLIEIILADEHYEVTDEDFIFAEELVHFIKAKGRRFQ